MPFQTYPFAIFREEEDQEFGLGFTLCTDEDITHQYKPNFNGYYLVDMREDRYPTVDPVGPFNTLAEAAIEQIKMNASIPVLEQ